MSRLVMAVAALLAALSLTACGGGASSTSAAPPAPVPAGAYNQADVMFAQGMIPHHQQAIEMAQLAPTRAASPELKALAGRIQAAQDPEINQMKSWLSSWGQPTSSPGGMGGNMANGMMGSGDMARLQGLSGPAFDHEFLTMMISHHQGAIAMAGAEQAAGSFEPAKTMAATIIRTQSDEITQMNGMLGSR
jgi:uncharacterized protein (DUF305 family)